MNTTINNINLNTTDDKILDLTRKLIEWSGKRVRATNIKKNGEKRTFVFVPRNNWNEQNGLETTNWGKKMVATKCKRGMATICEMLGDGTFAPRTLNLATVLTMELV